MTKRLRDLTVTEVSLVPAGAIRKRFMLMKSETNTPTEPATPAEPTAIEKALAEEVEGEKDGLDEVPEADREIVVALRRLAKGRDVKALLGIKDPAPVEKAETPAKDPLADLPAEAKAAVEAVFKAQAEAVAKAEALAKRLADAEEASEIREAVEKASKAYANLPVKLDVLGKALRTLRKADAKAADVVEDALAKANTAAEKLLTPIGKSDPQSDASGTAAEKIDAMAKDRVAKSGGKLLYATAYAAVLSDNPELYSAYEAEKREGAKGN